MKKTFTISLKNCYLPKLMLAILLIFSNCKKEPIVNNDYTINIKEKISARFFNINSSANPEIAALAFDIRKQDSIHHFLADFVRKNGYPVWDKVISKQKQTISLISLLSILTQLEVKATLE